MGHQFFSFIAWEQELTRVSQSRPLLANDRTKFTLYNRLEIIYICNSKKNLVLHDRYTCLFKEI